MTKKHAFISYCRDNKADVQRLHDALVASGETVWWDADMLPGQNWEQAIRRAIEESYAVILCLSAEFDSRPESYVYSELREVFRANERQAPGNIYLIPVKLNRCEIPDIEIDRMRPLNHLHAIDLFPANKQNERLELLLKSLQLARNQHERVLRIVAPPHSQLLLDLEEGMRLGGNLYRSVIAQLVYESLCDTNELDMAPGYDVSLLTATIRLSDDYLARVRGKAGILDWRNDFPQIAAPTVVAVAKSLKRSQDARAAVLSICGAIAKRLEPDRDRSQMFSRQKKVADMLYDAACDATSYDNDDDVLNALKRFR